MLFRPRAAMLAWLLAVPTLLAPAAGAATIGFLPTPAPVTPGESFEIEVVVSDLGGEVVSAYDLDIVYDSAVLSIAAVDLSPFLGDEALFEVLGAVDLSVPGVVDLAAVSLLPDATLLALQGGDSFALATLRIDAGAMGSSSLDFDFTGENRVVGGGSAVLSLTPEPGSVSVVPEPGAAVLFALGSVIVTSSIHGRRRREG